MPTDEDVMRWQYELALKQSAGKKAPRKKEANSASPEGAVVKACLQYLQMLGCFAWRNNTGGYKPYSDSDRVVHYGKVGSGDIIAITPSGKFLTCECKANNNKQSDYQLDFQRRVEEKKGIYILAYSVQDVEKRRRDILG